MQAKVGAWAALVATLVVTSAAAQAPPPQPPPPPGTPPPPPGTLPPAPGQPPQPYEPPPPAPQPSGPSAGGLYAPPPVDAQAPPPNETEQDLDESKEDDSERGLTWFWIDVEGGFQHVGLETFDVDESNLTGGLVSTEASGGFVGAGLGAQLLFLRLGPRFRVGFFPDWQMFSIGGELGFRIPIGILDLHVDLGGGYTALGSVGGALTAQADAVTISGPYFRVGGGLDFFIGDIVSLGPFAHWEIMGLTRPGVDPADIQAAQSGDPPPECETDPDAARECALTAEGSGVGTAVTIGLKLGLNF